MLELADIVRAVGEVYRQRYGARLLPSHLRALHDIEACRTAALGGHVQACDHCGALPLQPPLGLVRVALGTVPVATGVVAVWPRAAVIARLHVAPEGGGAAGQLPLLS